MEGTARSPAPHGPGDGSRCDLLLRGGHVVTVDDTRRVIAPGSVAVRGERIVAVGTDRDLAGWTATRVIECRDHLVLPGLVDGHNHLFQALARGLGEGMSIWPWLNEFMWPYAIAMTNEDAVVAARLGVVEALRAGTTTIVDHHYAPTDAETVLAVADVIEGAGLRGAVARGMLGRKTDVAVRRGLPDQLFRYSSADELKITRECMAERPAGGSVSVWPGPLNLAYVQQDLVRKSVELAREGDVKWHTHCSEGQRDPASFVEAYGTRPVLWLREAGLLDDRATLAHAIWLDDDEIAALGDSRAGVVHNPSSNGYLASGHMRLVDLRGAGAVVGLGSDGPSCGHRQDLFECMKQCLLLQRSATLDPTVLRAEDALELATRGGAALTGIDAGSLTIGLLADIVVVKLHEPHLTPLNEAVASTVYSVHGGDVETVICGGRIVVDGGRCTLIEEDAVMADAQAAAERLLADRRFAALRRRG